jgi:hypothetical protein
MLRHTRSAVGALSLLALAAMSGCAGMSSGGWTTLVDGARGMENFDAVGGANWVAADGAIQASSGGKTPGYLYTKVPYRDFMIRAEFWASDDANSGIFIRCQDVKNIGDETCYEANIFDQRPDPTYGTGAIVKVAPVNPMPKAGGKWNTYEITAQGDHLVLVLNGVKTVDVRNAKFASGPVALQWGQGVIKFRKVEIKPL